MRSLAVIPARAGSTRLKNKNIYPLLGKPLIRWITETVVSSNCFDEILVSTDGDEIFEAVQDLNVKRHKRAPSYATTEATVLEAMIDLMINMPSKYDVFAYFLPTCPFVEPTDIQSGITKLQDCDAVVSMTAMQETIQLACLISDDRIMPIFDNLECGLTNSKLIKNFYKPSGAFYMGKWEHLLVNKNFFRGDARCVIVPPERSIDINCLSDIIYAESVYNYMRIKTNQA